MKDVAGGYGTVFEVGQSVPARLLELAKGRLADLPPLTLGYLAAQLRAAGHAVEVHEVRRTSKRRDPVPRPDVAIVLTSMVDASAEREVLDEMRANGVRTVAVGAYASAKPREFWPYADGIVVGEPEALGAKVTEVDGIVRAGEVADLDALPFPDWRAFHVSRYRYAFLSRRGLFSRGPTLPVGASRGCPFGCGYCPWRVTAGFREREPARVAAEVEHLATTYGAASIAFRDPLFNLDPERTLKIAQRLTPLGIRFSAEMRADRVDEPLLLHLYRAGLRSMEIGVETADTEMLVGERRKPPRLDHIERMVRTAQRLGIRVICNYLLGLMGDDESRIRRTVALAKRLDSFAVQFTIATPYPGTTLEPATSDRMLRVLPDDHTGFRPVFRHPQMAPSRLSDLRERAYLEYHFRPRYIARFAKSAISSFLDR